MKRLLLTTLLLITGLAQAQGRWTMGGEGLAWLCLDSSPEVTSDQILRGKKITTDGSGFGFIANAGYRNGCLVSGLNYLHFTPMRSVYSYSAPGVEQKTTLGYQRADARLGAESKWGILRFGGYINGRWMHYRETFDATIAQESAAFRLGLHGFGGGATVELGLEFWGGLGIGGSCGLAGYYLRPAAKLDGEEAFDLPSSSPMLGGDAEVYLRHHYESPALTITLRTGLRAEAYAFETLCTYRDQKGLGFGGPFFSATVGF